MFPYRFYAVNERCVLLPVGRTAGRKIDTVRSFFTGRTKKRAGVGRTLLSDPRRSVLPTLAKIAIRPLARPLFPT